MRSIDIVEIFKESDMPSVLIEIRRKLTQEQEVAIMDAVHMALREAFKILPNDKTIRLMVHEPHRFACPPERTQPDLFTHVSIDAFAGRSLDAKRMLYKEIVTNLASLGIPADHVKIVLRDIPKENFGIRGGQAGCDVELGFNIHV
jgi:phenylpyruvate tautomerase PptA (4-oxalocrotonate tautomerase family)